MASRRAKRLHGPSTSALAIPEDTHYFLRHANMLAVDSATAKFLVRRLGGAGGPVVGDGSRR